MTNLSGVGTDLTLSPPLLNFGTQVVSTSGAVQAGTLTNLGTAPVTISSIVARGDYAQTNNCGGTLDGGASCAIDVTFTPTAPGTRFGTVTVSDSDGGSPDILALTGLGSFVSYSPTTLTFASQAVESTSPPQTVTVTNEEGTALSIGNIAITDSNVLVGTNDTGDFAQTNDCGTGLAAGASCTINVTFSPTAQGARAATLSITDHEPDSPQSVSLSGTGAPPSDNAAPLLSLLSPDSAAPGGAPFSLTVFGANFFSGSVVNWNGSARATKFVSSRQLAATILSADISKAGAASVTVFNPSPGGGTSNPAPFEVSPATSVAFGKTDLPTGSNPKAIATGDFNGDGKLDLAVANNASNTLSIYLGNGDGTFTLKSSPPTGSGPISLAVADLNGDGKADLVVGNKNDNTLSILLGNGDGTFTLKSTASTVCPVSVTVGDFNKDGKPDLAVANSIDPSVSILLGNGDGTFIVTNTPAGEGTGPDAVVAGDFNNDGNVDLAEVNNGDNTVSVLVGHGDGSFAPKKLTPSTGNAPIFLTVGNFNGDVDLDLAVANQNDSTLSILLGNGDGTFTSQSTPTTGSGPVWVSTGDFNGDGKVDLAVANSTANTVSILLGNGDGTFQTHLDFPTGSSPSSIAVGDFNGDGTLDLAVTDALSNTVSILLQSGVAGQPAVTLSPTSLTFPTQLIGTPSPVMPVTLTNSGSGTLTITSLTIGGTDPSDYSETNTCGNSVNAGASCTISVTFTPKFKNTRTATVSITDNAPGSPQTVPLTGVGTFVKLVPSSLVFGDQNVGTTSPPQTVTVTNTLPKSPLTFTISITGTDSTDFAQTNTCGGSVGPGASCTITVTFAPTATGTRTASVSLSDAGGGSPQLVPLSGTGVSGGSPAVTFNPTSLTYPNQLVGTPSPVMTVTLTNSGTGTLTITSLGIAGTDPKDFSETNTCGNSVNPGASCSINVTFTPKLKNTRTATVSISDNAPGSPQTVPLTGVGTFVELVPPSLAFGNQPVGTTSPPQTVTLTNTLPKATITITNLSITGTNSGDFAETNTCGGSVGPGASCTITVTFTPTATGARSAMVSISDDGGGTPQLVPLSGTGM